MNIQDAEQLYLGDKPIDSVYYNEQCLWPVVQRVLRSIQIDTVLLAQTEQLALLEIAQRYKAKNPNSELGGLYMQIAGIDYNYPAHFDYAAGLITFKDGCLPSQSDISMSDTIDVVASFPKHDATLRETVETQAIDGTELWGRVDWLWEHSLSDVDVYAMPHSVHIGGLGHGMENWANPDFRLAMLGYDPSITGYIAITYNTDLVISTRTKAWFAFPARDENISVGIIHITYETIES